MKKSRSRATNQMGENLTQIGLRIPQKTRDAIVHSARKNQMSLTEYICSCCAAPASEATSVGLKRRVTKAIYQGVGEVGALRASKTASVEDACSDFLKILNSVREVLEDEGEAS